MNVVEEIKFIKGFYFGAYIDNDIKSFENPRDHMVKFREIVDFANINHVELLGFPMSIYHLDNGIHSKKLFVGYPVAEKVLVVGSDFITLELPESRALKIVHIGDYFVLQELHTQLNNEVILQNNSINQFIIEEYIKYAPVDPEPGTWLTNIFYFIQGEGQTNTQETEKKRTVILILEDEPILSTALSKFLTQYGFDVVIAKDGNEAHNMINKRHFDLALLDLLVPGADGFSVLKKIRDSHKDMPVFILSNLEENQNKKKAIALGANKYFTKSNTLLSEVAAEINHLFNIESEHRNTVELHN